jgi:type II secretory pathway component PulF
MTLMVGTMSSIALMFFVLPQFKEIILATGLEMPFLLSFFVGIDMFSFNLYFVIFFFAVLGMGLMLFYGLKTLFATSNYAEQAKFLSFLAAVDKEERIKVITLANSRVLFPVLCNQLRSFSQALNSGENISQACESAGFSLPLCWFVTAGLESDNSTEMLDNGCQLIGSKYFSRFSMILNLVEVLVTVVLGLMLGTMIYTVFSAMMLVLEAGIK